MSHLSVCAYIEHSAEYPEIVRDQVESQLQVFLTQKARQEAAQTLEPVKPERLQALPIPPPQSCT